MPAASEFTTRPELAGTYGMVTTAGEHFDIDVPAFSLDSTEAKRTLN